MNEIQCTSVLHRDIILVYNQSKLIDFVVCHLFTVYLQSYMFRHYDRSQGSHSATSKMETIKVFFYTLYLTGRIIEHSIFLLVKNMCM